MIHLISKIRKRPTAFSNIPDIFNRLLLSVEELQTHADWSRCRSSPSKWSARGFNRVPSLGWRRALSTKVSCSFSANSLVQSNPISYSKDLTSCFSSWRLAHSLPMSFCSIRTLEASREVGKIFLAAMADKNVRSKKNRRFMVRAFAKDCSFPDFGLPN